ncbi:hypothetical protein DFH09DRAFT_1332353 [Mycena vulgaris]|nr:hypothetical protein DFH09DRAFT_1332353 [Mycena vulgaris]
MATLLPPTNMTAAEMVPDTRNPARDSRFWCLPPMRGGNGNGDGHFPMYLVTQGRIVGVWKSWTVTKAMVDGFPAGAQRGHHSERACVEEWQLHCVLGVHPHPVDPNVGEAFGMGPVPGLPPSPVATASPATSPPPSPTALHSPGAMTTSSSTESSVNESWDEVPQGPRFFALWKQKIVYGDRDDAQHAFTAAQARRGRQRIMSTDLYEEAQAFSEGFYWIRD